MEEKGKGQRWAEEWAGKIASVEQVVLGLRRPLHRLVLRLNLLDCSSSNLLCSGIKSRANPCA